MGIAKINRSPLTVTMERHDKLNGIQGTLVLPRILNEDGIPNAVTLCLQQSCEEVHW